MYASRWYLCGADERPPPQVVSIWSQRWPTWMGLTRSRQAPAPAICAFCCRLPPSFPHWSRPHQQGDMGRGRLQKRGASQWTPIGRPLDAHWTPIGRPLVTYFLQANGETTFTIDSEPVLLTSGSRFPTKNKLRTPCCIFLHEQHCFC